MPPIAHDAFGVLLFPIQGRASTKTWRCVMEGNNQHHYDAQPIVKVIVQGLVALAVVFVVWQFGHEILFGSRVEDTRVDVDGKHIRSYEYDGSGGAGNPNRAPEDASDEVYARPEESAEAKVFTDRELKEAQIQFPHDYRYTFVRAKSAIYGKWEHPEAFNLLNIAAEKAIRNGKADEMLKQLEEEEHSTFRKLIDHPEWHHLLEALEHEDEDELSYGAH